MSSEDVEFEEYAVGDRVRIITGSLEGETGFIRDFEISPLGIALIVVLEHKPGYEAVVLASMIESLEGEDDDELPAVPPPGMTSEQTAAVVGEFMAFCQSRILGVGDEQYGEGTHQKFEAMALDELIEYTVEELADIVNYSTFLYVRLSRIREALEKHV